MSSTILMLVCPSLVVGSIRKSAHPKASKLALNRELAKRLLHELGLEMELHDQS